MAESSKELDFDPYLALGLSFGASSESIGKAARKLGLKYHPDKNTDANAPAKFLQVQKAKEFLLDETKRKEYDDVHIATTKRKQYEIERNNAMDGKRKRFREDFESKLQKESSSARAQAADNSHSSSEKVDANRQLEIEMLRQDNLTRMEKMSSEMLGKRERDLLEHRRSMASGAPSASSAQTHQIKFQWSGTHRTHTEESIFQLLHAFGSIEDVVLLREAMSPDAAAIVTFCSHKAVADAVDAFAASEEYTVIKLTGAALHKPSHNFATGRASSFMSGVPLAFMKDAQRVVERHELAKSLSATSKWLGISVPSVSVEALAEKESDVLSRMVDASNQAKRTAAV